MEVVILIGIQASGKSTFVRETLFDSHVRINLDMLGTRHREKLLFEACLSGGQSCVIDNTNPTQPDRARYIQPARAAGAGIVGYYFSSRVEEALARNRSPERGRIVPDHAIKATAKKLQRPGYHEGFDKLFWVGIAADGGFVKKAWQDEI